MGPDPSAARVAAILNAAYLVRHYRRPLARALRAQALVLLAATVRDALNRSEERDSEALLYAVAVGLFDSGDRRFWI